MIPVVHTRWLNKEVETDGHSPIYFLCDAPSVYESIVENFLAFQPYEIETIIQSVFKQIPAGWESPKNLGERINAFLSDPGRIRLVKQLTMHSLKN